MSQRIGPYLLSSNIEFKDIIDSLDESFIRKERLRFIDSRLFWTGVLRREDICQQFELHETNASKDISLYRQLSQNNVVYDRNEKIYKAAPKFQPIGRQQSLQSLFSFSTLNMNWTGYVPDYLFSTPIPNRQPALPIIRNFITCAERGNGVEVTYHSMSNPEGKNRIVYPQCIIYDGLRWHARAFDMQSSMYRDFVLSRIESINDVVSPIELPTDNDWNNFVDVKITPHSLLSSEQQKVVEMDFNMKEGAVNIRTRQPLAFYIIRNLYLDADLVPPRQLIECKNWQEIMATSQSS